jgi:DNA-binding response OmpR family regulator
LPSRDGFSILQNLRRRGVNTPVLCLTARDGEQDSVKGLDLGADDNLVKPFAWEELAARVRSTIRRGHSTKSSTITVGDLEIDTAKKSARRGEKQIDLSAREYALLEYLGHRRDEVVSRTEIWDHLYDDADEVSSNVVDVYIGYLRNKIDKDFPTKLIQTKRGQGYMLSAES